MQFIAVGFLCLASLQSATAIEKDHPIVKVIDMVKDLIDTAKEDGQKEAKSYKEFKGWCEKSVKTLQKAIDGETKDILSLEDLIEGKTKEKAGLEKDLAFLEEQISKHMSVANSAKDNRDDEEEAYKKADDDYEATIDAIKKAITGLKEASLTQVDTQIREGLALVELYSPAGAAVDKVTTFLQKPRATIGGGDFKSGDVIGLLDNLLKKFKDDREEATKAETNAQNEFELMKGSRSDAIKAAKDARDSKEKALSECKVDLAEAKEDRLNKKDDKAANEETLHETDQMCTTKAMEFQQRTKTREGEIEAMKQAIKILKKVTGVRTEAPSFEQSGLLFLQTSLGIKGTDPAAKALNALLERTQGRNFKALRSVVENLKEAEGVSVLERGAIFKKIIGMVQELIFQLMAAQKDEDEHKLWCDKELSKTNTSIKHKDEKLEELDAIIKDLKAKIVKLNEDIKDADESVADIEKHMKEATEMREEAKKENLAAIADADSAVNAIAKASEVLTEFYKESGMIKKEPWEFIQRDPVELPSEPKTWDSAYTGASDPSNQPDGILTVLEETSSDFMKMKSETKAQEETDQKAYDEDMSENKIEKSRLTKESEMKSQQAERLKAKQDEMEKKSKHVTNELYNWEIYLKDLQPACVEGDSTYEDRKAARAKELSGLREAQAILEKTFKESE